MTPVPPPPPPPLPMFEAASAPTGVKLKSFWPAFRGDHRGTRGGGRSQPTLSPPSITSLRQGTGTRAQPALHRGEVVGRKGWGGCHGGGGGGRDALEGKGPQSRLARRVEEVAKAVGGGCCRLQMPLRRAGGGQWLGIGWAPLKGGVPPSLPLHPGGVGGRERGFRDRPAPRGRKAVRTTICFKEIPP